MVDFLYLPLHPLLNTAPPSHTTGAYAKASATACGQAGQEDPDRSRPSRMPFCSTFRPRFSILLHLTFDINSSISIPFIPSQTLPGSPNPGRSFHIMTNRSFVLLFTPYALRLLSFILNSSSLTILLHSTFDICHKFLNLFSPFHRPCQVIQTLAGLSPAEYNSALHFGPGSPPRLHTGY